ncbi:hypothetical protein BCV70DRAFT_214951 [Testicularia cyperi]|uniref:Uncharacterized protein n=1 Tax=Testicularia cyperi TaxID=1882483 RepID=A0A317Y1R1_9BASI|nr:hypothetical protein BCV70DRAFT_214951 [Testicularia cyperi]
MAFRTGMATLTGVREVLAASSSSSSLLSLRCAGARYASSRQQPPRSPTSAPMPASMPVSRQYAKPPPPPPSRSSIRAPQRQPHPTSSPSSAASGSTSSATTEREGRGGNAKSIVQSYKDLAPRTRIMLATAIASFAVLGILISDKLEELYPSRNRKPSAGQENASSAEAKYIDHEKTAATRPKLFSISVVDRTDSK